MTSAVWRWLLVMVLIGGCGAVSAEPGLEPLENAGEEMGAAGALAPSTAGQAGSLPFADGSAGQAGSEPQQAGSGGDVPDAGMTPQAGAGGDGSAWPQAGVGGGAAGTGGAGAGGSGGTGTAGVSGSGAVAGTGGDAGTGQDAEPEPMPLSCANMGRIDPETGEPGDVAVCDCSFVTGWICDFPEGKRRWKLRQFISPEIGGVDFWCDADVTCGVVDGQVVCSSPASEECANARAENTAYCCGDDS